MIWDDLSFAPGSSHQKMGKQWLERDECGQHSAGWLWSLNNAQLVLKKKCAKKVSLTPLHQQPEPLIQGPCFHMVYAKFWWYHQYVTVELETCQTRQHLSQPVSYPVCWPCPGWWWTLRSTSGWGREMCSGWGCSQCQTWDLWPGSGM